MTRWFLSLLAFPLCVSALLAEQTRLAIISDPELANEETLLASELSKSPDIVLIERQQLERIARERGLQIHGLSERNSAELAKLLNANGLLWMQRDPQGSRLSARLIAVEAGAILEEFQVPFPVPEPQQWAKFAAAKMANYSRNIAPTQGKRIPISILRIKAASNSFHLQKVETELAFLIGRRLMQEPSVFVLERWRLDEAAWEKQIKEKAAEPFWSGSYLLDGTLTPQGTGYVIDVRLRPAGGGGAINLRAESATLLDLTEQVVTKVASSIHGPSIPVSWNREAESEQYLDEARWAFRWKVYAQAQEAAEASWALGNRSEDLGLLRPTAYGTAAAEAARDCVFSNQLASKKPPLYSMTAALRSLDTFDEAVRTRGAAPLPARWLTQGTDFLWMASTVLQAVYFAREPLAAEESELLPQIRSRCRVLAGTLTAANAIPRKAADMVWQKDHVGAEDRNIVAVRGLFGGLWSETADESDRAIRSVFNAADALETEVRARTKSLFIAQRTIHHPLITNWSRAEAEKASGLKASLVSWLVDSKNPERELDGLILAVKRCSHLTLENAAATYQVENANAHIANLIAGLWKHREGFARKRLHPQQLLDALELLRNMATFAPNARISGLLIGDAKLTRDLFEYFLAEQFDGPQMLYGALISGFTPTPEEAARMSGLIEKFRRDKPEAPRFLSHYPGQLQRRAASAGSPQIAAAAGDPSGAALRFWQALESGESPARFQIQTVLSRGDRLWVQSSEYVLGTNTQRIKIAAVDARTKTADRISFDQPNISSQQSRFEIIGSDLFITDREAVLKYNMSSRTWLRFPMPGAETMQMWAVGDALYLTGLEGSVVRMEPRTGKTDVLASSRRRPAQTILDDVPPYRVLRVFAGPNNELCAAVQSGAIFAFNESQRQWRSLHSPADLFRNLMIPRELLLRWIGRDRYAFEIYASPHELLILDSAKSGRLASLPKSWPANLRLSKEETGPSGIRSAASDGTNLWVLYLANGPGGARVKKFPPAPEPDSVFKLDLPQKAQNEQLQLCTASNGLVVWGQRLGGVYFFPFEGLDPSAKPPPTQASDEGPSLKSVPPPPQPEAPAAKQNPKAEDFLGKWKGRWDGQWQVQFTVTKGAGNQLSVLYEWQEVPGKPLASARVAGVIKNNALQLGGNIEITISAADPEKARAVGHFSPDRIAELARENLSGR